MVLVIAHQYGLGSLSLMTAFTTQVVDTLPG